jgi:predicted MFS family arabinose efflux permease
MLWLNFAPLLTKIQSRYGVGELTASTLVLIFPLLYVLLSIPAGAMIDSRGYRFTVGLGAAATAAFSLLRIDDASFWTLFAGQVGIALAQPFVVNGISKLVADWFDEAQGAIATGLATVGLFLGMAMGMAATPALEQSVGLRWTMVVFSAIAAGIAILFIVLARPNGAPSPTSAPESAAKGFGALLRNRSLLVLFAISFLGLGAFNGLTTWLEEMLAPQGIDATAAGLVGGILIVGGIVGAVVIPLLSDLRRRRKPFLFVCAVVATACIFPLCTQGSYRVLLAIAATLGFFFMPAFALLLDMSAQLAGAANAGAATSLVMLAGNGGGVLVILAMPVVKGQGPSFRPAAFLLVGLLCVATVLAALTRETFPRKTD